MNALASSKDKARAATYTPVLIVSSARQCLRSNAFGVGREREREKEREWEGWELEEEGGGVKICPQSN